MVSAVVSPVRFAKINEPRKTKRETKRGKGREV